MSRPQEPFTLAPSIETNQTSDKTESSTSIRYLDTADAYDLWSEVYDTDGNFLQALDTIEMKILLPKMLESVEAEKPWRIIDLGCGTGRNTLALLGIPDIEVTALDLSPKMLEIAQNRLRVESERLSTHTRFHTEVFNLMTTKSIPELATNADAIVSTLVMEHTPLRPFFTTAANMLRTGGLLLITNMHSEMGNISQAGFVDPKTGEKVRPKSYAHTAQEVVHEAQIHGFKILDRMEERSVDEKLAPALGPRANKWIGIHVWYGGIFRKVHVDDPAVAQ